MVSIRKLIKQLRCKHTHTFTAPIQEATWFSSGRRKGGHNTLRLRGCYVCGYVTVEDFGA